MGTINYKTSDYITLGLRPYDFDDFANDPECIEEITEIFGDASDAAIYQYISDCYNADRGNIEYILEKWDFYYFHITIEPGYYEGFSLNIENNFPLCFDCYDDKRSAQKEITGIRQFLRGCAGLGLVKCSPGWCTGYYSYAETLKAIDAAVREMRDEVSITPTWKKYMKEARTW